MPPLLLTPSNHPRDRPLDPLSPPHPLPTRPRDRLFLQTSPPTSAAAEGADAADDAVDDAADDARQGKGKPAPGLRLYIGNVAPKVSDVELAAALASAALARGCDPARDLAPPDDSVAYDARGFVVRIPSERDSGRRKPFAFAEAPTRGAASVVAGATLGPWEGRVATVAAAKSVEADARGSGAKWTGVDPAMRDQGRERRDRDRERVGGGRDGKGRDAREGGGRDDPATDIDSTLHLRKLHVGSLPADLVGDAACRSIRSAFERFGAVESVTVPSSSEGRLGRGVGGRKRGRDDGGDNGSGDGRHRGFGFCIFVDTAGASAALAAHGGPQGGAATLIDGEGRPRAVTLAPCKPPRVAGGGRGDAGGGPGAARAPVGAFSPFAGSVWPGGGPPLGGHGGGPQYVPPNAVMVGGVPMVPLAALQAAMVPPGAWGGPWGGVGGWGWGAPGPGGTPPPGAGVWSSGEGRTSHGGGRGGDLAERAADREGDGGGRDRGRDRGSGRDRGHDERHDDGRRRRF